MESALQSGIYVVINGRPYPADEVPGAKPIPCMLRNAAVVLETKASKTDEELKRVSEWLTHCVVHGKYEEQSEAMLLATSLPRKHYKYFAEDQLVIEAMNRHDLGS